MKYTKKPNKKKIEIKSDQKIIDSTSFPKNLQNEKIIENLGLENCDLIIMAK